MLLLAIIGVAAAASTFHNSGLPHDGPHVHACVHKASLHVTGTASSSTAADIGSASFQMTIQALDLQTGYDLLRAERDAIFNALAVLKANGTLTALNLEDLSLTPDPRIQNAVQGHMSFTLNSPAEALFDAIGLVFSAAPSLVSLTGVTYSSSPALSAAAHAEAMALAAADAAARATAAISSMPPGSALLGPLLRLVEAAGDRFYQQKNVVMPYAAGFVTPTATSVVGIEATFALLDASGGPLFDC